MTSKNELKLSLIIHQPHHVMSLLWMLNLEASMCHVAIFKRIGNSRCTHTKISSGYYNVFSA